MADKTTYEEGVYACQIMEHGLTKAKSGTFAIAIKVKVLGVADPSDAVNYTPHKLQYNRTVKLWITDKTVGNVVEKLRSIGFEGDAFTQLDPTRGADDYVSLAGRVADFYCKHEPSKESGDVYERWDVARSGAGKPLRDTERQLEDREMRQLDSLFGKALKGKKATPPPPPDGDALEVTDDDIPF